MRLLPGEMDDGGVNNNLTNATYRYITGFAWIQRVRWWTWLACNTAPERVPAVFYSRLELGPLSSHGRDWAQQVVLKVPQLEAMLSGRMFHTTMQAQDSTNWPEWDWSVSLVARSGFDPCDCWPYASVKVSCPRSEDRSQPCIKQPFQTSTKLLCRWSWRKRELFGSRSYE